MACFGACFGRPAPEETRNSNTPPGRVGQSDVTLNSNNEAAAKPQDVVVHVLKTGNPDSSPAAPVEGATQQASVGNVSSTERNDAADTDVAARVSPLEEQPQASTSTSREALQRSNEKIPTSETVPSGASTQQGTGSLRPFTDSTPPGVQKSSWEKAKEMFSVVSPEDLLKDIHELKFIGAGGYGKGELKLHLELLIRFCCQIVIPTPSM